MTVTPAAKVADRTEVEAQSRSGKTRLLHPRSAAPIHRPRVRGKFLFIGEEKLYVRGATYGTFRPGADGTEYPEPGVVERDFALMAESGINAVRTYTVPPGWLLDLAQRHRLRVMVGLPWEQHIAFLNDPRRSHDIEQRVRAGVRACAGHPAVLCYAIGNEIPAQIVRWHGHERVERFLKRLYDAAKAEDPDGLVTYVNYPSTEYLYLPFVDFVCFNVYLEERSRLEAYLARLQNLTGDRPLVMAEIGLDSRRHGMHEQGSTLDWQLRNIFAAGCAGAFVFSWTDEWCRGGYDVEDWDFGLTDRDRAPKPALATVRNALADVPFPEDTDWPGTAVVVCSYNGSGTIRDCLDGLRRLDYPDFEVIVVDDGSSDGTGDIAREYGFRVISTENHGLSSARNTGLEAATGKIVAYLDDDAYPDPHWLRYLALTFLRTDFAAVGGPNLPPPGDGPIADCVANAPGGPVHVLLSDQEAEHIPGCNMAFRRDYLQAIGGFDPQFRAAGDDVDVCWRLREHGWKLGFSPAAVVWHHRRNSVRAYWKQQVGYGKAEALLERKWPEQYNGIGHRTWGGRVYGLGLTPSLSRSRGRIYQGIWGSAPFQSLYSPASGVLSSLPLMPEWYLVILVLTGLAGLGMAWRPMFLALPLLAVALGASIAQALLAAKRASFASSPRSRAGHLKKRGLTAVLHLLQPFARLLGRVRHGLTPWRWRGAPALSHPLPRTATVWSERWQAPSDRLHAIETAIRMRAAPVHRGGEFDHWDLEVRGGILGGVRLRMAAEEHGGERQLLRFRMWPIALRRAFVAVAVFSGLGGGGGGGGGVLASLLFDGVVALLVLRLLAEWGTAMAIVLDALPSATNQLRGVWLEEQRVDVEPTA